MTDITLNEDERRAFPAWCPNCGEASPDRYPVKATPETIVGCLSCATTWTREELAALRTVSRSTGTHGRF